MYAFFLKKKKNTKFQGRNKILHGGPKDHGFWSVLRLRL